RRAIRHLAQSSAASGRTERERTIRLPRSGPTSGGCRSPVTTEELDPRAAWGPRRNRTEARVPGIIAACDPRKYANAGMSREESRYVHFFDPGTDRRLRQQLPRELAGRP